MKPKPDAYYRAQPARHRRKLTAGITTSLLFLMAFLSIKAGADTNAPSVSTGNGLKASPEESGRRTDRRMQQRIGVNCLPGDNVRGAADRLPLGWYKDYSFLGKHFEMSGTVVDYVPILTYQGKLDNPATADRTRKFWDAGKLPKRPGATLDDVLDGQSLARLRGRLSRERERFPFGTLFQLGIEPGYSANGDGRSPAEIVQDARQIKAMLNSLGRGYRLALGGIVTSDNQWTKQAYGGRDGIKFLQKVLDACDGFEFDALVVHPYYATPAHPSFEDSRDHVIAFRRIMAKRGLRKTDLLVGEIGVPFAGATRQQAVAFTSRMVEFLLTATDVEIGNPEDGNRLVQKFCWVVLSAPTFKIAGWTDNPALDFSATALLSPEGELTAVGKAFRDAAIRCVSGLPSK